MTIQGSVLGVMADGRDRTTAAIERESGLSRNQVKGAVRELVRKGKLVGHMRAARCGGSPRVILSTKYSLASRGAS
jgi:predicted transcriptional regulator